MSNVTMSLLSVADVAKEFGCDEASVLRLIMRGALRAGLLPPSTWRVIPEDLYAYVRLPEDRKNFRNMSLPENNPFSEKLVNWLQWLAQDIERSIWTAAGSQILTDQSIEVTARQRLGTPEPGPGGVIPHRSIDLQKEVLATPEIRAVFNEPYSSKMRVPGTDYRRFGDGAGNLLIAALLVEAVSAKWREIRNKPATEKPAAVAADPELLWLYASADSHRAIVKDAVAAAFGSVIEQKVIKSFPDRGAGSPMPGAINVSLLYRVRMSALTTAADVQKVAEKLF